MRKLAVLVAIVIAAFGGAIVAHAASLSASSNNLGAGSAAVIPCATAGVEINETRDTEGKVSEVRVEKFGADCVGGLLELALTKASGDVVATGDPTAIADIDGSDDVNYGVVFTFTPSLADVSDAHVAVVGP